MVRSVSGGGVDFSGLEMAMRRARESSNSGATGSAGVGLDGGADALSGADAQGPGSFTEMLEKGIREVNTAAKDSEKASMDLAAGRSSNIHETMLAATKAEIGFNMLVQLRNKAIEAYQEVMRMQV